MINIANNIQKWKDLGKKVRSTKETNRWFNIIGKVDGILRRFPVPSWFIADTPLAYFKLMPAINSVDYIIKMIGTL